MIALFRQRSPGNIAVLLITALLLKLPYILQPKILVAAKSDGPLYAPIVNFLNAPGRMWATGIFTFLLLYLQAMVINFIMNEYRMSAKQTFLPAMAFVLITTLLPEWNYMSAPLIASLLVLISFVKVYELYQSNNVNARIFNIGLLIGFASFFYFPSVFFSVCALIGLMILRPFRINHIFLFIIGFLTTYYFYAAILFLADKFSMDSILPNLYLYVPKARPTIWLVGATVLLGVPFLIGGYYVQNNLRKMLIQARKNWSILLIYVMVAIFVPFVNNTEAYTNWIILAAPFAAFHACAYLYPPKRWVANLLFFVMVLFILLQQYAQPFIHLPRR